MKKHKRILILFALLVCGIIVVNFIVPLPAQGTDFENPIGGSNITSVEGLIKQVTKWIIGIFGSIALVILIFAGFRYLTAGADESKAESAKKMLTWAIIGIAIVLGSAAIVNELINAFGAGNTSPTS
ncbi:MAG: pilin [Patescibacteria group bacterium]|nr:pilin [Patescibacteria group bacterium]